MAHYIGMGAYQSVSEQTYQSGFQPGASAHGQLYTNGGHSIHYGTNQLLANRLDSDSAESQVTLNIGNTNAEIVNIGRAGYNTYVRGDLTVDGTFYTTDSETVLLSDNFINLNAGYVSSGAQEAGIVLNIDPANTSAATVSFTAPGTIVTDNNFTFQVGDIIAVSGTASNDGLYEVANYSNPNITIVTGSVSEPFLQNILVNETVAATVAKVAVGALTIGDGVSGTPTRTLGEWYKYFDDAVGGTWTSFGVTGLNNNYLVNDNAISIDGTNGPIQLSNGGDADAMLFDSGMKLRLGTLNDYDAQTYYSTASRIWYFFSGYNNNAGAGTVGAGLFFASGNAGTAVGTSLAGKAGGNYIMSGGKGAQAGVAASNETAGYGGSVQFLAGAGGNASSDSPPQDGGFVQIRAGVGGSSATTQDAGTGGNVYIEGGYDGAQTGAGGAGTGGNVYIAGGRAEDTGATPGNTYVSGGRHDSEASYGDLHIGSFWTFTEPQDLSSRRGGNSNIYFGDATNKPPIYVYGRLEMDDGHIANSGLKLPIKTTTGNPADVTGSSDGDVVVLTFSGEESLWFRAQGTWHNATGTSGLNANYAVNDNTIGMDDTYGAIILSDSSWTNTNAALRLNDNMLLGLGTGSDIILRFDATDGYIEGAEDAGADLYIRASGTSDATAGSHTYIDGGNSTSGTDGILYLGNQHTSQVVYGSSASPTHLMYLADASATAFQIQQSSNVFMTFNTSSDQIDIGSTANRIPLAIHGRINNDGHINNVGIQMPTKSTTGNPGAVTGSVDGDMVVVTYSGEENLFFRAGSAFISAYGLRRITGSTYYSQQDAADTLYSAGWISGGVISDAGGGTIDVTAGTGCIRSTSSRLGDLYFFDWLSASSVALTAGINYVGVEYNSGAPQIVVKTTDVWDYWTEFPIGTVVYETTPTVLHIIQNPQAVGDHTNYSVLRNYQTGPVARDDRSGGLILGETGTRNVTVTAGALWDRLNRFAISAIDTSGASTMDLYYYGGAGWARTTAATQWPNTQYNTFGVGLTTMTDTYYSNLWFYVELDGALVMVYDVAEYADSATAEAASPPATIPPRLQAHGKLIGRILFQKSASTATEIQSAFVDVFTAAQASDHGNLSGLSDDDHGQYTLLAGTLVRNTLTGDGILADDGAKFVVGTGSDAEFYSNGADGILQGIADAGSDLYLRGSSNSAGVGSDTYLAGGQGTTTGGAVYISGGAATTTGGAVYIDGGDAATDGVLYLGNQHTSQIVYGSGASATHLLYLDDENASAFIIRETAGGPDVDYMTFDTTGSAPRVKLGVDDTRGDDLYSNYGDNEEAFVGFLSTSVFRLATVNGTSSYPLQLATGDITSGATAGSNVNIFTGDNDGTGHSGSFVMYTGSTAVGGSGFSGNISCSTGRAFGDGGSGSQTWGTGDTDGSGKVGNMAFTAGTANGTGNAGNISFLAGETQSGTAGTVTITAGTSFATSGTAGSVYINGGSAGGTSTNGGDVYLRGGSTVSGTTGLIYVGYSNTSSIQMANATTNPITTFNGNGGVLFNVSGTQIKWVTSGGDDPYIAGYSNASLKRIHLGAGNESTVGYPGMWFSVSNGAAGPADASTPAKDGGPVTIDASGGGAGSTGSGAAGRGGYSRWIGGTGGAAGGTTGDGNAAAEGGWMLLSAGLGGQGNTDYSGAIGGNTVIKGGDGGPSGASNIGGDGGNAYLMGGEAPGSVTGGNGGDVYIAGGNSDNFTHGKVVLGAEFSVTPYGTSGYDGKTSSIEIGNTTGNPPTTFLGTGLVSVNAGRFEIEGDHVNTTGTAALKVPIKTTTGAVADSASPSDGNLVVATFSGEESLWFRAGGTWYNASAGVAGLNTNYQENDNTIGMDDTYGAIILSDSSWTNTNAAMRFNDNMLLGFGTDSDGIIYFDGADKLYVKTANSATAAASKELWLRTGDNSSTGFTNAIAVWTGDQTNGTLNSQSTGELYLSTGWLTNSSGASGNASLRSGNVNAGGGASGEVGVLSGNISAGDGASGAISVYSGTTPATGGGNTGIVSIYSGNALGSGSSGNVRIATGTVVSGTKGVIDIDGSRMNFDAQAANIGLRIPTATANPTDVTGYQVGDIVARTDSGNEGLWFRSATQWERLIPGQGGGTLDYAYDFGGAGAGRSIAADTGSVQITGSGTSTEALDINVSGTIKGIDIAQTGSGSSLVIAQSGNNVTGTAFTLAISGAQDTGNPAPNGISVNLSGISTLNTSNGIYGYGAFGEANAGSGIVAGFYADANWDFSADFDSNMRMRDDTVIQLGTTVAAGSGAILGHTNAGVTNFRHDGSGNLNQWTTEDAADLNFYTTGNDADIIIDAGNGTSTGSDVLIDATAGVSIDSNAASNFTVDSGSLTLNTTTSGAVIIDSFATTTWQTTDSSSGGGGTGALTVQTGEINTSATGVSGNLVVQTGWVDTTLASSSNTGTVTIRSGNTASTGTLAHSGTTGAVLFASGSHLSTAATGNTGSATLSSGATLGASGASGGTFVITGNAGNGSSGDVALYSGTASTPANRGVVHVIGTRFETDAHANAVGLKIPTYAGDPSGAGVTTSETGDIVWDATNFDLYAYNGSSWTKIGGSTAGDTLQTAYNAGSSITLTSGNNLDVNVPVSGNAAITLDANAASNFSVVGANLTLSTTTSGSLLLNSVGAATWQTFDPASSTASSVITIRSGNTTSANSGDVTVTTGTTTTTGNSGDLYLKTGTAADTRGDVRIESDQLNLNGLANARQIMLDTANDVSMAWGAGDPSGTPGEGSLWIDITGGILWIYQQTAGWVKAGTQS